MASFVDIELLLSKGAGLDGEISKSSAVSGYKAGDKVVVGSDLGAANREGL